MIILFLVIPVFLVALLWLVLFYSFLLPPKRGLPILMYHKVSDGHTDGLTVTKAKLEEQFCFIRKNGYRTLFFSELAGLAASGKPLPRKSLVITFDDAYESFLSLAFPLLEKYDLKATLFIPAAYIGKTNVWDHGSDPIMSAAQLRQSLEGNRVELGLHSFNHKNYREMTTAEMKEDLQCCMLALRDDNLPFVPVLAYPYGGYPRKNKLLLAQMKDMFREVNLRFALRIGNRINSFPIKEKYELKRIDIKGTDSFFTFRIKLRKGRQKLI